MPFSAGSAVPPSSISCGLVKPTTTPNSRALNPEARITELRVVTEYCRRMPIASARSPPTVESTWSSLAALGFSNVVSQALIPRSSPRQQAMAAIVVFMA